ncbi:restriction endonuclease subunit S [Sphingobacterium lumbrici]|uniref:restriction endonuclease subunit S n=1 Tax=Sphingobacterium lumbrici TaxID=2559600 RepID=UPI00112DB089|nr:restriction endonuclease subunit S [Sphingobacterium lumbrici]
MMVQDRNTTKWISTVPEHWKTLRIKNLFAEIDERSETGEEELLSVSHYTGVTKKRDSLENEDDFISNAKTLVGYKKVAENDLVSNIMLAWNGSLGISKYDGITSPAYCVYRIKGENNPHYYGYLFSTAIMKAEFRKKSFGIIDSRLRLYSDKFFSIPVAVPPKDEQDQIVFYIKAQSKKIKHFIQKKQAFIELLKEQRQAVSFDRIHQDGIEKGYPQRRIKSFAQILRGKFSHRPRNDQRLYDGDFPFIQTGDVSQANKYIESYKQTLNEWGYSVSKEFPKGTLCLTIAANVGDVAILNFNACFPDSIIGIVPNSEVDLDYLYYALKSFKAKFISESTLTTQYNINIEKVGPIKIPLPTLDEQLSIVSRIKTETAKIDQAISKTEKEIELIKEYREAMIVKAVLGKLDLKVHTKKEMEHAK